MLRLETILFFLFCGTKQKNKGRPFKGAAHLYIRDFIESLCRAGIKKSRERNKMDFLLRDQYFPQQSEPLPAWHRYL